MVCMYACIPIKQLYMLRVQRRTKLARQDESEVAMMGHCGSIKRRNGKAQARHSATCSRKTCKFNKIRSASPTCANKYARFGLLFLW